MRYIFTLCLAVMAISLSAQPSQFDFPCAVNPLSQTLFQLEVQINGGLASENDFIAVFDDSMNVIGVAQIVQAMGPGGGFTTGTTVGIAQQNFNGGCPPNYGAADGEKLNVALWVAATGEFLTTANNGCFNYSTNMFGFVQGPDGDAATADLFNFTMPFAPLPVELVYFRGAALGQDALLQWATAVEIDNDYFEVQHSTDGRNFSAIGQVQGFGTRQEVAEYEFVDDQAVAGTNYYRLRQVDFDGSDFYTDIVPVQIQGERVEGTMALFPNPALHEAQVVLSGGWQEEEVRLHLTDMNGRLLRQLDFGPQTQISFSVTDLAAGIYFVTVSNGTDTMTERLVKQ